MNFVSQDHYNITTCKIQENEQTVPFSFAVHVL